MNNEVRILYSRDWIVVLYQNMIIYEDHSIQPLDFKDILNNLLLFSKPYELVRIDFLEDEDMETYGKWLDNNP